jgi:hypothetical protein
MNDRVRDKKRGMGLFEGVMREIIIIICFCLE